MTTTQRADSAYKTRIGLSDTFRQSVMEKRTVLSLPFGSFHHGPSNKTSLVARQHGPVVVLVRHGDGGDRYIQPRDEKCPLVNVGASCRAVSLSRALITAGG